MAGPVWILRGGVLSGRASIRCREGYLVVSFLLFPPLSLFCWLADKWGGSLAARGVKAILFTKTLPPYLPPPCSLPSSLHFPTNLLLYEFPSFFLSFLFPFSLNVRAPPASEKITCMSHPSHPQTLYFSASLRWCSAGSSRLLSLLLSHRFIPPHSRTRTRNLVSCRSTLTLV